MSIETKTGPEKTQTELLKEEISGLYEVFPESERSAEFNSEVARLTAELELAESIQTQITALRARNIGHNKGVTDSAAEVGQIATYRIDPEKTGTWIRGATDVQLDYHVSTGGSPFWVGVITELSNATEVAEAITPAIT